MTRRRKRGRKQPAWKKWARMGLSIAGTIIGGIVATAPLHRGIRDGLSGNVEQMVVSIQQDVYGGPDSIDIKRVTATGFAVALGIGLIKLFKYIGKRV